MVTLLILDERDVAGPVPGQADHAAGADAGRGRARDWRRPAGPAARGGDERRARLAGRVVQHDGGRAAHQPGTAGAVARGPGAQERRGGGAPAVHRDDPRAGGHRRHLARRRRARLDGATAPRTRLLGLRRAAIGQPAERDVFSATTCAPLSRSSRRRSAASRAASCRRSRWRATSGRCTWRRAATVLTGDDGPAGRRRAGARRRHAADPRAAGGGLARCGAPAGARDQEPADADPVERRAAAAAISPACRRTPHGAGRGVHGRDHHRGRGAQGPGRRVRAVRAPARAAHAARPISTRSSTTRCGSMRACCRRARCGSRGELAPRLPVVRVDAEQIRQVIINLVDNASRRWVDPPRPGAARTARRRNIIVCRPASMPATAWCGWS